MRTILFSLFVFLLFSCSSGDISGRFQPLGEDKKPLEGTSVIISPAGEGFLIEQLIHDKVVSEAFTSADEKGRYSFTTSIGLTDLEIVLWKKGKNKIKGYSIIPVSEKKTEFVWIRK